MVNPLMAGEITIRCDSYEQIVLCGIWHKGELIEDSVLVQVILYYKYIIRLKNINMAQLYQIYSVVTLNKSS